MKHKDKNIFNPEATGSREVANSRVEASDSVTGGQTVELIRVSGIKRSATASACGISRHRHQHSNDTAHWCHAPSTNN